MAIVPEALEEIIAFPQAQAGGGPPVYPGEKLIDPSGEPYRNPYDFRRTVGRIFCDTVASNKCDPNDPDFFHPTVVAERILRQLYDCPATLLSNTFFTDRSCPEFIKGWYEETFFRHCQYAPDNLARVLIEYGKNTNKLRGESKAESLHISTRSRGVSPLGGFAVSKFYFVPNDHLVTILLHDQTYNTASLMCGETNFCEGVSTFRPITTFLTYVEGPVVTAVLAIRPWDGQVHPSYRVFTEQVSPSEAEIDYRLHVLYHQVSGLSGFDYSQLVRN